MKTFGILLFVLVLSFGTIKPLTMSGFFTIHDDEQIARLFELDSALSDGQIPVRWVQNLGFGFGYPLFNFYPPFTYYLGEIFHKLGLSFIDSMKTVVFVGFLGSSFFMYLWVKNHFGKFAGIFSALLYTYSSYHAIDIYVRGDIPEFFSFVWIPAVFWSSDQLFKTQKPKYVIILSILLALVVLTHSLIAFPFLFFFIIYIVFLMLSKRSDLKKNFFLVFTSASVSSLLSIFFWLPVFLEKKFTLVDHILTRELANYKIHFVYLRQLWESPWGYGGSIFGLYDGLSFEVGKIHLILSLFAALVILTSIINKRKLERSFKMPLFIFLLLLVSLYMTSFHSQWIWDKISLLSYLQFPWRFLLFAAVFSSFLGGFFISLIEKKFDKSKAMIVLLILGTITIMISAQNFKPAKFLNVDDSFYTNPEDIKWRVSKMSFEFVPGGIATKISDIQTTQVAIERSEVPNKSYKVLKGDLNVRVLEDKSHFKKIDILAKTSGILQINTFSFPGWEVSVDGERKRYRDDNKLKLIVIDIPTGEHSVEIEFKDTPPRKIGNTISLITLIVFLGWSITSLKIKNKK